MPTVKLAGLAAAGMTFTPDVLKTAVAALFVMTTATGKVSMLVQFPVNVPFVALTLLPLMIRFNRGISQRLAKR